MTIRTATGLIAWYLRTCGFRGWTSFWCVIYVLPGNEHDQRLLRHERKHLEQIERDGRLLFSIKYLYWLCRYGYKMCPYEVENEFTSFILSPRGRKQNDMTEQTKVLRTF